MGKIENITLMVFNEPRLIRIYIPSDETKSYPVIYMHDGHNLFDPASSYGGVIWDVQGALDEIEKATNKSFIIVGIDCHPKNRLDEYSPWVNNQLDQLFPEGGIKVAGGKGNDYLKWIVYELKPYIDNHYHTLTSESFLAGSSMGGLISLYGGLLYPQVFKGVGCFSSAFWFAKSELEQFIVQNHRKSLNVYLDVGTMESNNETMRKYYLNDTQDIASLLKRLGTEKLKLTIDEGGKHHELAWQKRFPDFIMWLFKK